MQELEQRRDAEGLFRVQRLAELRREFSPTLDPNRVEPVIQVMRSRVQDSGTFPVVT